jgi:hypothetical protein
LKFSKSNNIKLQKHKTQMRTSPIIALALCLAFASANLYQADFTVKFDDAAAMRLEAMQLTDEEANFATFIGIVEHSAEDFQEFLQGAFYKIHDQLKVEIYPELRATKRKVF